MRMGKKYPFLPKAALDLKKKLAQESFKTKLTLVI